MQQSLSTRDYYSQFEESRLEDDYFKSLQATAWRQVQTPAYVETGRDIVNSINNMSSEIASSKEVLSVNNELLKATNDLLLQIAASLSIFEAQSYFWTQEWQKAEKEATHDIAAGRVHTFEGAEQLIDFLHSQYDNEIPSNR